MNNRVVIAILAAITLLAPVSAFGKMKAGVDISTVLNMLSTNYDKGMFPGVYGFTIYHVKTDKVKIAIENSEGARVFEHVYFCDPNNDNENPSCYVNTDKSGKPTPYSVRPGAHTFKIYVKDDEVYSLKYKLSAKIDYGYKNVYVTGDWKNIAGISTGGSAYITIYSGDPGSCAQGGDNLAQVQLFRDGAYIGKGHYSPGFSPYCSTSAVDFTIFSEDDNRFTKWVNSSEILSTDGDYEIKYFEKNQLVRTYGFTVADGQVKSSTSKDKPVQDALTLENLVVPYQSSAWVYAK